MVKIVKKKEEQALLFYSQTHGLHFLQAKNEKPRASAQKRENMVFSFYSLPTGLGDRI